MRKTTPLLLLTMIAGALSASPSSLVGDLTEQQKIVHLLNRMTFGPTARDIERVQQIGRQSYLEEQLSPSSIRDSEMSALLKGFETLFLSPTEIARKYGTVSASEGEMMVPMDRRKMSAEQRQQMQRTLRRKQRELVVDLTAARLLRAVASQRQLHEVMTDFWMNHFNVFLPKGFGRFLTTDYELNVIRPNALGKFEDLLVATAKSPSMLFYLDNWLSSAPEDDVKERIRAHARKAGFGGLNRRELGRRLAGVLGPTPALYRAKGLNENYARELLELHTVGVEGGYTQQDIIEVARAFTGWTITSPEAGARFRFQPIMHEAGNKTVMGKKIGDGDMQEGLEVLRFLAHHPSTARYIAYKLAVRFVSDDPPEAIVGEAERAFLKSGGDIKEVLKAIFLSPAFYSPDLYRAKVKKPFELVASTARALDARIGNPRFLVQAMTEMGERLYHCLTPDGYSDVGSSWINTNSLLNRLNFAMAMASGKVRGVRVDLDSTDHLFALLQLPEPDTGQRTTTAGLLTDRQLARSEQIIGVAFKLGSPTFQKR